MCEIQRDTTMARKCSLTLTLGIIAAFGSVIGSLPLARVDLMVLGNDQEKQVHEGDEGVLDYRIKNTGRNGVTILFPFRIIDLEYKGGDMTDKPRTTRLTGCDKKVEIDPGGTCLFRVNFATPDPVPDTTAEDKDFGEWKLSSAGNLIV